MMKKIALFLIFALLLQISFVSSAVADQYSNDLKRKIVVFKEGFEGKDFLLKKYGIEKIKHISLINSSVVNINANDEARLIKEGAVKRIDEDAEVFAYGKPGSVIVPPPQTIPWGIKTIQARDVTIDDPSSNKIKVGIIDTGIDLSHPDLKAIIKPGTNTINSYSSTNYNDDNGHGTHVAGIIAALDNNIGAVGVSDAIELYPIKVLNKKGSGYVSDIIEGLQWAVEYEIQVVNMSLGTSSNVLAFEEAIINAYKSNLVMVAAAGNDYAGAVNYPAKYEQVIAVSATDINNNIASFSNIGPEVDVAAPGVGIYSTYKGSSYATLSGTSMAAPHVAGVAALIISEGELADINNDSKISPDEVLLRIQSTAMKIGGATDDANYSLKYGAGIVNARNAVNTDAN